MNDVTAVILGGGTDFGRCPVATRLPRALWPVVGRSILEYQLEWLWSQGIRKATVCATGRMALDEYGVRIAAPEGMEVKFASEKMPRGTAGSVKDAARGTHGTVIVIKAGVVRAGSLKDLLEKHRESGAVLTAFTTEAPGQGKTLLSPAGVYICEAAAIEAIPEEGYQDIKEQLIPGLLRRGLPVGAAWLGEAIVAGRDLEGYLALSARALSAPEELGIDLGGFRKMGDGVYVGEGASVSEEARLYGPVVIMPEAVIESGAAVIGPSVIGRRALVSAGSIVDGSVVWDGGFIGRGACVAAALVDRGALVAPGSRLQGKAAAGELKRQAAKLGPQEQRTDAGAAGAGRPEVHRKPQYTLSGAAWQPYVIGALAALAAFWWAYADVLGDLWRTWTTDDDYSSGLLVPLLAGYAAYSRRKDLGGVKVKPALWGVGLVIVGFALRLGGTALLLGSVERFSILAVVAGIVLTVFGVRLAWRLKWVLLFTALMFPWPRRIHAAVSLPLQSWATTSAVFMLELLGWVVVREGNVLRLGETTVAVAEACSGLRMLTAFMTVSGFVALLVRRSWWEKAVIVVSSIPIAVLCNTVRLTVTAIAFDANYGPQVNKWFHDFGGLAMMPLAMAMLAALMWLMRRLAPVVPEAPGGDNGGTA